MPQKRRRPAQSDSDEVTGGGEQAKPYGTLAEVQWLLDDFVPPADGFDAKGSWQLGYSLWLEDAEAAAGYLEIRRETAGANIVLDVRSAVTQSTGAVHHTSAKLLCAPDALCSPRSWQLESALLDAAGSLVASTRLTQSGTVHNDTIQSQLGNWKRARKVPLPFTSNWSLFDAVQRAPGAGAPVQQFALLEDLDLLKPRQRLSFLEKITATVAGGKQLPLDCYEQTGEGVLPFHYWVDAGRRILFALSGTRAYLYDPQARSRMETKQKTTGR